MRYVGYCRISSEDQVGNYSLDAQQRAIAAWVAVRGGELLECYQDEAVSGRTLERPALLALLRAARRGAFDALVVHRLDRVARGRVDALAVKAMLRFDFGVKVFSVTEPTVDSDSAEGAAVEEVLESIAEWYSESLAQEVAKGKRERSRQGFHNNRAPFGMMKDSDGILVPNPAEITGLVLAFEAYSRGDSSDRDIAAFLNAAGYRSTTGRPFSKDTVRDLLQNRTYLGKIKYQRYRRRSDGRRRVDGPVEWFEGRHGAVIDAELFERCQQVRAGRRPATRNRSPYRSYLLRDLVYCQRCFHRAPTEDSFRHHGKMRCRTETRDMQPYYRCRSDEIGDQCPQPAVPTDIIDEQVVARLVDLSESGQWPPYMVATLVEYLARQTLLRRLDEIRRLIESIYATWQPGHVPDLSGAPEQRARVVEELQSRDPLPKHEETVARDLLEHFGKHWQSSHGKPTMQRRLISLLVRRVEVRDEEVVRLVLRAATSAA